MFPSEDVSLPIIPVKPHLDPVQIYIFGSSGKVSVHPIVHKPSVFDSDTLTSSSLLLRLNLVKLVFLTMEKILSSSTLVVFCGLCGFMVILSWSVDSVFL